MSAIGVEAAQPAPAMEGAPIAARGVEAAPSGKPSWAGIVTKRVFPVS
jgi:hypothetical protein